MTTAIGKYQKVSSALKVQEEPDYKKELGDPDADNSVNGEAYFLSTFDGDFMKGTNAMQIGETNLTEAMQDISKNINQNKDTDLKSLNDDLGELIRQYKAAEGDKDKRDSLMQDINKKQSDYKVAESSWQSLQQAMNPITTSDSDVTTSISQNNNQIFQIAMYVMSIATTLTQLIRMA